MSPQHTVDPAADERFMRRALELAEQGRGRTSPNPMVGAVVVLDGKVVGEGYHHAVGCPHAEVEALTAAGAAARGATLYVTLEPCSHEGRTPPCAPLVIRSGVARVVAAMVDPNPLVSGAGIALLRGAGIRTEVGLLEREARLLNEAFIAHHLLGRPIVTAKWAMTLDGRIATQTGHSRWISNEESRAHVHVMRTQADGIMVGIGTVLADNPQLTIRMDGYEGPQPRRIIVDGTLRIPLKARCLEDTEPGHVVIATTESGHRDKVARLRDAGHEVLVFPGRRGILDLRLFIRELHQRDIQSILCEGGSTLNGALFQAHLVDKIVAFVAPKLVGGNEPKAPTAGWGVQYMTQALVLQEPRVRCFGTDVCIEGYVPGAHRRIAEPVGEGEPAAGGGTA